jgi:hypothetical protein
LASYPTSAKSFTSRSAGQTIGAAHMNDVQDEINAIETALVSSGLAHHLLFVDATYDIGQSGSTRPRHLFMSGNATIGGTLSVGGNVVSNLLFTDATYDIGASGATRPRDLFLSRNATIGGTLDVTGVATFTAQPVFSSTALHAGHIVFSATSAIRQNTSDGSDNREVIVNGGGATTDTSRGAFIRIAGNEFSGAGGYIIAQIGNVASAAMNIRRSDQTDVVTINGGTGGVLLANATGGDKGLGTLNAIGVYDDNTLLTDWVFDLAYDGAARPDDPYYRGQRLYTLGEIETMTREERRLPWMVSRVDFERDRSLGALVSQLWQGAEQTYLHLFDIERRVRALEAA